MRMKLVPAACACAALLLFGGCTTQGIPQEAAAPLPGEGTNPFEEAQDEAGLLAMVSHEAVSPPLSEEGDRAPFSYEGGEFRLDYRFSATGNLDSVGFLLFLDGRPQPYRVDGEASDYVYCHRFDAAEDQTVTFAFQPVCGEAGDVLNLTIVSLTNPDFRPDMEATSSYGWYHSALPASFQIRFDETADAAGPNRPLARDVLSRCSVHEEKATAAYVDEELSAAGWPDVTFDTLDDGIYYSLTFGGDIVYDNLPITGEIPVRFTLCGTPGKRYDIAFFLDNQPVEMNGETSCSVTLSKGGVAVVEGVIDPERLADLNTFYCLAAPADSADPFFKTNSILLYKEA